MASIKFDDYKSSLTSMGYRLDGCCAAAAAMGVRQMAMNNLQLAYIHLGTVLPAFLIGAFLLLSPRKGTALHKLFGKSYMVLMLTTAFITLFMPTAFGLSILGHIGFIHLLIFVVFYSVPAAYIAARKGDIEKHKSLMQGLYVGGVLLAGAIALMPGRMLHTWIF